MINLGLTAVKLFANNNIKLKSAVRGLILAKHLVRLPWHYAQGIHLYSHVDRGTVYTRRVKCLVQGQVTQCCKLSSVDEYLGSLMLVKITD